MSIEKKTMTIGKWEAPRQLFDDYVRFSIMADSYLDSKTEVPSILAEISQRERVMRFHLCVSQMMKIHREICSILKISYSEDYRDEFYSEFHKAVSKQTKLKG